MKWFNTKFGLVGWVILFALIGMGAKIGDNILRIGDPSGSDIQVLMGDNGILKWNDASQKMQISEDGGSGFQTITDLSGNSSSLLENTGFAASVGAGALTIDLKTAGAASDPSAGSPVKIAFRDATSATGSYDIVSVTAALGITVPSGATLGHSNGVASYIYLYALNNAGTAELAVSTSIYDEGSVVSTTLLDATSDSATAIYSAVARSNVPLRMIARLSSNQATAGTWNVAPTEITPYPYLYTYLQSSLLARVSSGANNTKVCIFGLGSTGSSSGTDPLNCASSFSALGGATLRITFSTNWNASNSYACTCTANNSGDGTCAVSNHNIGDIEIKTYIGGVSSNAAADVICVGY